MEEFISGEIEGKKFNAFITKNKPECLKGEHSWDGDVLYSFYNSDKTMTKTDFEALSEKEQRILNLESGQVSCSKCGIGYMSYDNPYYSEI